MKRNLTFRWKHFIRFDLLLSRFSLILPPFLFFLLLLSCYEGKSQALTLTCPANITTSSPSDLCRAWVNYAQPMPNGGTSPYTVNQTEGIASGNWFPLGVTTNTFEVTDDNGDMATCSFTVTVEDNTPPIITCRDITIPIELGECEAKVDYLYSIYVGLERFLTGPRSGGGFRLMYFNSVNYNLIQEKIFNTAAFYATSHGIEQNPVDGLIYMVLENGMAERTLLSVDPFSMAVNTIGNTGEGITDMTFDENGTLWAVTGGGGGGTAPHSLVTINLTTGAATAASPLAAGGRKCLAYNQLDGLLYYHYQDNNSTNYIQAIETSTYTVVHQVALAEVIDFASTMTVSPTGQLIISTNDGLRSINPQTGTIGIPANVPDISFGKAAIANDNCSATISGNIPASGSIFPIGTTTLNLTATDGSSNSSNCTMNINIEYNFPSPICQGTIANIDADGQATIVPTDILSNFDDFCGAATFSISQSSFDCSHSGNNLVTLTAMDNNGMTATCNAIVVVEDNIAPTITCPENASLSSPFENCGFTPDGFALVPYPYVNKIRDANGLTLATGHFGALMAVAYNPNLDLYYGIHGGSSSEPLITFDAQGNILSTVNAGFDARGMWWNPNTNELQANAFNTGGYRTIDLDVNGHALSTGTEVITGLHQPDINSFGTYDYDNNEILFQLLGTIYRHDPMTGALLGTYNLSNLPSTIANFDNGSSSGTINAYALAYTGIPGKEIILYDYVFKRIYTINKNTGTYSGTIQLPGSTQFNWLWGFSYANGQAFVGDAFNFTAYKIEEELICPTEIVQLAGPNSDFIPVGIHNMEFEFTDGGGNTSYCSYELTVTDPHHPDVRCKDIVVSLDSLGVARIDSSMIDDSSFDACGLVTLALSQSVFDCSHIGENTITMTGTDPTGLSNDCTALVTVEDNFVPQMICPENIVVAAAANTCEAVVNYTVEPVVPFNPTFYTEENIAFAPQATTGTALTLADDEVSDALPIGFDFKFYNNIYSTFYISSNGFITFNSEQHNGCCSGDMIPDNNGGNTDGPNNLIAFAWGDLDPPEGGTITYQTMGTSPNRILVVSFENIHYCCDNTTPSVTAQLLLYEGTNVIEFHSTDIPLDAEFRTMGVENINGTEGQAIAGRNRSDTWSVMNEGIRLTPTFNFDNCNGSTIAQTGGLASGATYSIGVTTNTFTITDAAGNMSSCDFSITVEDNEMPMANCKDITVPLDAQGNATISAMSLNNNSTDNCNIATFVASPVAFDCTNIGMNSVELSVTDDGGNTATCTSMVTIEDQTPPTAICKNAIIQLDVLGQAELNPEIINNGSSDLCGMVTLAIPPTTFTCHDLGTNLTTLTVTDESNNMATCTAIILVEPFVEPKLICPEDVVVQTSHSFCELPYIFDNPYWEEVQLPSYPVLTGSFSVGSGQGVAYNPNLDLYYALYAVSIGGNRITTFDAQGNSLHEATTTGFEGRGLWWNPNTNQLEGNGFGNQGYRVFDLDVNGYALGTGTGSPTGQNQPNENSSGVYDPMANEVLFYFNGRIYRHDRNTGAALGDYAINNLPVPFFNLPLFGLAFSGIAGQEITLLDNTYKRVYFIEKNTGNYVGTFQLPVDAPNFNTDGMDYANGYFFLRGSNFRQFTAYNFNNYDCLGDILQVGGLSEGADFPLGTTTMSFLATTNDGSSSACNFTVTIDDTTNPFANCKDITISLDAMGQATITPEDVDDGSNDNCGVVNMTLDQSVFDCSHVGLNTVTLSVTDEANNTRTCTAGVVVEDHIAPAITCPESRTVSTGPNACDAVVNYETPATSPVTFDAYTLETIPFAPLPANGAIITLGDDEVSGAIPIGFDFNFFGNDYNEFYLSSNGFLTFTGGQNVGCCSGGFLPTFGEPDNLIAFFWTDLAPNLGGTITYETIGSSPNRILALTFDAVPICCEASHTMTAQVLLYESTNIIEIHSANLPYDDNINDDDKTMGIENRYGTEAIVVPGRNADYTWSTTNEGQRFTPHSGMVDDNCDGSTILLTEGLASGAAFPMGTTTNVFTITDPSGNTASCSFSITVEDGGVPMTMCQNQTISLNAVGEATITVEEVDNGSSDLCGTITDMDLNITTFTCEDIGENTVTLSAIDNNGNTGTCNAIITVTDGVAPQAHCNTVITTLGANGTATITAEQVNNNSTDNCGIANLFLSPTQFDCNDLGVTTAQLMVMDAAGNSHTCTALVLVDDPIDPMANCKNATIILDESGLAILSPTDVDNGSTDNCDIEEWTLDQEIFTCQHIGTNQVEMTVMDEAGNDATCQATVTIEDHSIPNIVCPENRSMIAVSQDCAVVVDEIAPSMEGTDNCGSQIFYSLSGSTEGNGEEDASGTAMFAGMTTVTYTVEDEANNRASCNFTVEVRDTQAPAVQCPTTQSLEVDLTCGFSMPSFVNAVMVIDNCSNFQDITIMQNPEPGTNLAGPSIISTTLTIVDAANNASSCIFNVETCLPSSLYTQDNEELEMLEAEDIDAFFENHFDCQEVELVHFMVNPSGTPQNENIIMNLELTLNYPEDGQGLRSCFTTVYFGETPLAIKELNFKASTQDDQTALLEWGITEEFETDFFIVERSPNAKDFNSIGKVVATATDFYSYLDINPLTGWNYYRLQWTDDNGTVHYSEIEQVWFDVPSFNVQPNPTRDIVQLLFDSEMDETLQIEVYNSAGQLLYSEPSVLNENGVTLSFLEMNIRTSGVYWIKVRSEREVFEPVAVVKIE